MGSLRGEHYGRCNDCCLVTSSAGTFPTMRQASPGDTDDASLVGKEQLSRAPILGHSWPGLVARSSQAALGIGGRASLAGARRQEALTRSYAYSAAIAASLPFPVRSPLVRALRREAANRRAQAAGCGAPSRGVVARCCGQRGPAASLLARALWVDKLGSSGRAHRYAVLGLKTR